MMQLNQLRQSNISFGTYVQGFYVNGSGEPKLGLATGMTFSPLGDGRCKVTTPEMTVPIDDMTITQIGDTGPSWQTGSIKHNLREGKNVKIIDPLECTFQVMG